MQIDCSNCLTTINLNLSAGTVSHTPKAQGRASKRTEAVTTTNPVWDEDALWSWEAPCCEDYWDSLEKGANA